MFVVGSVVLYLPNQFLHDGLIIQVDFPHAFLPFLVFNHRLIYEVVLRHQKRLQQEFHMINWQLIELALRQSLGQLVQQLYTHLSELAKGVEDLDQVLYFEAPYL